METFKVPNKSKSFFQRIKNFCTCSCLCKSKKYFFYTKTKKKEIKTKFDEKIVDLRVNID